MQKILKTHVKLLKSNMSDYYKIHHITDYSLLKNFLQNYPFATITANSNASFPSLVHVPILMNGNIPEFHIANANPDCGGFDNNIVIRAVCMGPNAHISPAWYRQRFIDKPRSHTAPTWNYLKVEIKGQLEKMNRTECENHLERLVFEFENKIQDGWKFKEIDISFLENLLGHITGFRIANAEITGLFKLSQDQNEADQKNIIEELKNRNNYFDYALAIEMEKFKKS